MNPKFTMAETREFSEELAAEIGLVWDEICTVNMLTSEQWLISSLRVVCSPDVIINLMMKTFIEYLSDETEPNLQKVRVIVDCSRHDCFNGDPRYNAEDHTFYDDAVGFVYDGYDLMPNFVDANGNPVMLDPNSGEENMPNLLDILLAALQQDTPTPSIVTSGGQSTSVVSPNFRDVVTARMRGIQTPN